MSFPKFQRTAVTDAGDVIAGATITVRDQNTGLVSTIYSDRAGTTGQSNPFNTLDDGLIEFFAREGEYRVEVVGGAGSIEWEYVQLGGTAAILDAQTSQLDDTDGRLMKKGAFGLGDTIAPSVSDFTGTPFGTAPSIQFFSYSNSTTGAPSDQAANGAVIGGGTNASALAIERTAAGGKIVFVARMANGVVDGTGWVEQYGASNLNQFEFEGASGTDCLGIGQAVNSTTARFYLPVNLLDEPSGITTSGGFSVARQGTVVFSAEVPVYSNLSSNRICVVQVEGLSGLITGEFLTLRSDGTGDKITVNP